MFKEIGSNFWLNRYDEVEHKEISLDYLGVNIADVAFLSTGRSAISFVLEHIQIPEDKKIVLLPPFTCHTVIEPFINAGFQVQYYRINKELLLTAGSLLEDIDKHQPSVVLAHSYFGFNTLEPVRYAISEINNSGITFIEDITQTLYSKFERIKADYYIFSFRKWAAFPDGGCAISTNEPFLYKPDTIDEKLLEAKLKAFHAKYLYINKNEGDKAEFLRMFQEAEELLDDQEFIYDMTATSKALQGNLDIDYLRKQRRENYQILASSFACNNIIKAVFSSLPDNVTPLYFPIFTKCDRKVLQSYLSENYIYAPVIWPKPTQCIGAVCKDVDWLYEHVICLPCDQRYNNSDMERVVSVIKKYEKNV